MERFLCDEMLARLCRYLRAAGYDAALASDGIRDRVLLQQCQAEARRFLTLDRRIHEHKAAAGIAMILPSPRLEDQAQVIASAFGLDWLSRAFTRCLVDNTPLLPATAGQRARFPWLPMGDAEPVSACPGCGRVYWRGSHYRRMRERLEAWQHQRLAVLH
ncbi:MAG: hypothetical protein JNL68_05920 [Burkholderiales bacterium]|nr:hypothetical protein [Burkholderiales bacterium]